MYLHVGGEYTISSRYIIGIFNLESVTSIQKDMIHFLSHMEKEDKVEYISEEIPRTVVVTNEKVYFTPISTLTLKKRIKVSRIL